MSLKIKDPDSYHVDIKAVKIINYDLIFPKVVYDEIKFDIFDEQFRFVKFVLFDSMQLEVHFTKDKECADSHITRQSSYVFKACAGMFLKRYGINIYDYKGIYPVVCRMCVVSLSPIICIDLSRRITQIDYSFSYTKTNGHFRRQVRNMAGGELSVHKHTL
jgi:hypothetical protein